MLYIDRKADTMNTLRIVQKPEHGRLVIDLPEELANQEVEITVKPLHQLKTESEIKTELAEVRKLWGIGKDSSFNPTEEDYYHQ